MDLQELQASIDNLTRTIELSNKQVFTKAEAAKYLNIGLNAITDLIKSGEISYKKNGSVYLFHRSHLDDWMLSADVVVMESSRKKRRA